MIDFYYSQGKKYFVNFKVNAEDKYSNIYMGGLTWQQLKEYKINNQGYVVRRKNGTN